MPRRNANGARDRGRYYRNARSAPRFAPRINMDRIGLGRTPTEASQTAPKPTVRNEFTRHVTGFSSGVMELLLGYGFEHVDEGGFVPVHFSGITRAPRAEIEYHKPSLVKTRGGIIVLSGLVDTGRVKEIGHDVTPIRRVDEPDLDSHNAPRRLNVALGQEPDGFDDRGLTRQLVADCALVLSEVTEINGFRTNFYQSAASLDELWRRT
jgi:hypothetical protein